MQVSVYVPATSANLGCGFDVFGLALALYSEFVFDTEVSEVEASGSVATRLRVEGDGAETLLAEGCGLIFDSIKTCVETFNLKLPPFKLTVKNKIPLGRGLGSSAAAIIGGLVGAMALAEGANWQRDRETLLRLATKIEGHPDNVGPALYGGLPVAISRTIPIVEKHFVEAAQANTALPQLIVLPLTIPDDLETVIFIPDFEMSTKAARAVLPLQVPFGDAVYNMGRTSLFAAIFASPQPPLELLAEAMADRLHQPYRTQIFPQLPKLIEVAQNAGAYGAALSGAGSSILAFVASEKTAQVQTALQMAAQTLGVPGRAVPLPISHNGTQVTFTA